jgi:N-acetylneuraminic acid mutarotase
MKKLLLPFYATLVLVVFLRTVSAQTNIWEPRADFGGSARWGSFGFSIGQYGFIGGGFNVSTLNDLWQYDPTNNSWTQKNNMPFNIRTASSFVINNKAYVVGGIENVGNIVGQLWEYDPVNDSWTAKASYPGSPVYGAAGFAIGSKGYFGLGNAGSANGPYKSDFYEYDPAINTWTKKANFPGPVRYGSFGIASNGLGYVTGGVDENSGALFNDWWEYNPINNTWNIRANFPGVAVTYPQGFVVNGKIYVGTGQDYNIQYSQFYQFNQSNNTWVKEADFGGGNRWLCAGFAINGNGYFGTGTTGNVNYKDFWIYKMDTSTVTLIDTCIVIKPDALAGKDIHIINSMPNFNNDPHPEFLITAWTCGGALCNDRQLIQFDLSSIPANAILTHAGINLFANPNPVTIPSANYGTNNSFVIQRITSPWNEQTVTWNTKPTAVNLNQVTVPQSSSANQNCLDIDVTNLVKDMLNDSAHSFGFNFQLVDESNYYNGRDFATSDNPNSSKWPSIQICYRMPKPNIDSTLISTDTLTDYINVFPNPFVNDLQVEVLLKNSSDVTIEVFNAIGQIVFEKSYFQLANEMTVVKINSQNLQQYPASGVYFINVITNNKSITEKLIKTN